MNYFRITGYCKEQDFSFIMDCNGVYEKLWQFSAYLIQKGLTVLEVSGDSKFSDGNLTRAAENDEQFILRATAKGKPEYTAQQIDGVAYKAIKVADKIYIPDRTQTI